MARPSATRSRSGSRGSRSRTSRPEQDEEPPGLVQIRIAYRVRATNDRRNLVYPFYVIPREDA